MLKAAADAEKKGWERMRAYTDESLGHLAKNKMTIVKPQPQLMADMRKIGDEMMADWLKQAGGDGKEIVDTIEESVDEEVTGMAK